MKLEITRIEGQRNDLLLRVERAEIESARLSVSDGPRLLSLPGMPRHRPATPAEQQGIADCKIPIEEHLRRLGVTGNDGRAASRAVAISNRNLGTNQGHLAWRRAGHPRVFRIHEDPGHYGAYSCLTAWSDGRLAIEDLSFDVAADRVHLGGGGRDVSDEIEWATFGQRVLSNGVVVGIDALAGQFYDARHLLAFDPHTEAGERIRKQIYSGYPVDFETQVRRAWHAGVPRARYVHNAVGLSAQALIVVQREGTVEEIGEVLRQAGATDGVILDNGGSIACWVWWANDYAGGMVSPTVDYRPPGTSAIAFFLKGPVKVDLPGGSVTCTTV